MQRPTYSVPPANSPPLHHPVPQHVSTVPQLRSPPPPVSQNSYGYGQSPPQGQQQQQNGQAAGGAGAGGYMHPAFGGFMNDPTAQMGLQMGQSAMKVGQEYVEQNINRFVNVSALKHYFNVTNRYVLTKLLIVLFPWRHRPWSRQQSRMDPSGKGAEFLPPREDVNSPDMYIPLMAFVTYVLLSTLIAGLNGKFEPQLLGITFSNASIIIILELVFLWLGRYLLNINSESQIYDLVAYSGYKFVGVIVTIALAAIFNRGQGTGGWVGWTVFAYTFNANAFFLLRSLKYVLLPSDNSPGNPTMQTIARSQRTTRTYFLFGYSYVVQFAFMWWLSALDVGSALTSKTKGGK
ncbi:hypothetical protein LTR36_010038 [Oleoguttula mirabilis]|uniref:Protein YIF1 n=1 Tax=Oleoguttula mirabilis TaxID=1507867 RepID=A0AAV9JRV6_9PEZI|nr:hypothetical protein LTR36_010038 [Oleoguttula mirabilis]